LFGKLRTEARVKGGTSRCAKAYYVRKSPEVDARGEPRGGPREKGASTGREGFQKLGGPETKRGVHGLVRKISAKKNFKMYIKGKR